MSGASSVPGMHAPAGPGAARRAFVAWLHSGGSQGRDFLQLSVWPVGSGEYEIRHRHDRDLPEAALDTHSDPYAARVIAQTTAGGEHRPLKTAPNLRRGWRLTGLGPAAVCIAVDYLYPAGIAHWHAGRTGAIASTSWVETAARQSGIYSAVGLLPEPIVRMMIDACCDDRVCLRTVAWGVAPGSAPPLPTLGAEEAVLPCPEACSLFISLARKVLRIEREPRQHVDSLGTVNACELDQLRRITLAAAKGELDVAREGDFEDPTNSRRVRYLAARLLHRREDTGEDGTD